LLEADIPVDDSRAIALLEDFRSAAHFCPALISFGGFAAEDGLKTRLGTTDKGFGS